MLRIILILSATGKPIAYLCNGRSRVAYFIQRPLMSPFKQISYARFPPTPALYNNLFILLLSIKVLSIKEIIVNMISNVKLLYLRFLPYIYAFEVLQPSKCQIKLINHQAMIEDRVVHLKEFSPRSHQRRASKKSPLKL